jgi:hypothetical protein
MVHAFQYVIHNRYLSNIKKKLRNILFPFNNEGNKTFELECPEILNKLNQNILWLILNIFQLQVVTVYTHQCTAHVTYYKLIFMHSLSAQ